MLHRNINNRFKSLKKQLNRANFRKLPGLLRESVSGTEQDFTQGSLAKAIVLLSIPMVLEMLMESIFAIADIFFVSKQGAEAVAIVGLTESIVTIVYAIGFGLSMATTAMVSRRIGEKRSVAAASTAFQAMITGLIISILISVPGILFASDMLALMGASQQSISDLGGYTAIVLGSNTVIMLLFIINAVFRSAGDAAISLRVLLIANFINIVLDPLLIFGIGPFPELGIEGAAIATVIGRGLAVLYQLWILFYGKSRIRIIKRVMHLRPKIIFQLIKLSLGGIGQNLIGTASWIGLMRIMSEFGNVALAGYTIAIRIVIFVLLPAAGLSNAAATLLGQNLGAGKPERAQRAVAIAGNISMLMLGLAGLFLIVFPTDVIRLFIDDPAVIASGAQGLQIVSLGFVFYGLGMVYLSAINGAGDTYSPTWINIICFWLIEIPLAWLTALHWGMHEAGVYVAIIVAESMLAIMAVIWFKQGKWKTMQV